MMPTMSNGLLINPDRRKWKGLTVYCYRCKTNVSKICKESGKPLSQCKHGESHVYKVYVHVRGTKNQRRTKKLDTRDLNEAIKQAIEFEQTVKSESVERNENQGKGKIQVVETQNKPRPVLLVQAFARYIGWLHNEGVPAHMIKERSEEHVKDVERVLKQFLESLKEKGHHIQSIRVEDINNELVGEVYSSLEGKQISNRTFNKYFGYYTSFMKWYGEEYDIPIRNPFTKVHRKNLNPKPEAITHQEYVALLNRITPENGIKLYHQGVKTSRNLYRPWLIDGIRLGLETGRRREEIINLKWKDVQIVDGTPLYICTPDLKVNRIQKRNREEEKKYIYIPVTESLRKLLKELAIKHPGSQDEYILAPEIQSKRGRVMSDVLSRGFSHYYDQLGTGRKLTFKSLRKAYITNLEIFMHGENTRAITGHSGDGVIERNYLDKKEIAKASKGFCVFPEENERASELKEIRTEKNNKNQQRELGV